MRPLGMLVLLIIGLTLGCGKSASAPPPPTFGVTGKVVGRDGQPLSGGIIQFVSKAQPTLNMSATINADGTFKLQTLHVNQNVAGAIQGPCEVMITPPFQGGQMPEIIVLKEPYTIEAKENHFEIKLPS